MCTYRLMHRPTVGRYIGRLSVNYRSTIGRLSVDYRPIVGRLSTDSRPINVYISGDALVDYRSIYQLTVSRLSVDCQLPTDSWPIVNLYIGRLSAYMLTEATYSTHDPTHLIILNYPVIHSNQCSTSFFRNLPTLFITKLTPYHFIRLP